jgi:hypothetical protein
VVQFQYFRGGDSDLLHEQIKGKKLWVEH